MRINDANMAAVKYKMCRKVRPRRANNKQKTAKRRTKRFGMRELRGEELAISTAQHGDGDTQRSIFAGVHLIIVTTLRLATTFAFMSWTVYRRALLPHGTDDASTKLRF